MKRFLLFLLILLSCNRAETKRIQGYVEGEYVYISSAVSGNLEKLHVSRGAQVAAGTPLFALEASPEEQRRIKADEMLKQAQAVLEDRKKGKRPTEIEALKAQLKQADAGLNLAEQEFDRQEKLSRQPGVTSKQDFDRAKAAKEQASHHVEEIKADLETQQLGARADDIVANEANVRAMQAALAEAVWGVEQKRRAAPEAAFVFDTLYREGEWIPAGRPVVSLLPPGNIKLRAFVPETRIATIHLGDTAAVSVDGVAAPITGKVSYISPQAEFTPPVIYSRDTRSKLVFRIEIVFEPGVAATLHPGQPADVDFAS